MSNERNFDFEKNIDARLDALLDGCDPNDEDLHFLVACIRHWKAKADIVKAIKGKIIKPHKGDIVVLTMPASAPPGLVDDIVDSLDKMIEGVKFVCCRDGQHDLSILNDAQLAEVGLMRIDEKIAQDLLDGKAVAIPKGMTFEAPAALTLPLAPGMYIKSISSAPNGLEGDIKYTAVIGRMPEAKRELTSYTPSKTQCVWHNEKHERCMNDGFVKMYRRNGGLIGHGCREHFEQMITHGDAIVPIAWSGEHADIPKSIKELSKKMEALTGYPVSSAHVDAHIEKRMEELFGANWRQQMAAESATPDTTEFTPPTTKACAACDKDVPLDELKPVADQYRPRLICIACFDAAGHTVREAMEKVVGKDKVTITHSK